MDSLMRVSLNKPLRHDQRNKERGINRKHQNIVPNKYKINPGELSVIKQLQQGNHTRIPVNKDTVFQITNKYNLDITPGVEKCINSNSNIFIKVKFDGTGEVYKK